MGIQKTPDDGVWSSIQGATSPRPHATILRDDPDLKGLNLGPISGDPDEEHKRQTGNEKFASQNNAGPTLVLSSGYFRNSKTGERLPQWVARLGCGTCGFHKIYDSWAQMTSNIPNDCQSVEVYDDCPMRRGKMMRQYEARQ